MLIISLPLSRLYQNTKGKTPFHERKYCVNLYFIFISSCPAIYPNCHTQHSTGLRLRYESRAIDRLSILITIYYYTTFKALYNDHRNLP